MTTGHESEVINVSGLKASLQKLKTDILPLVNVGYVRHLNGTYVTSTALGRTKILLHKNETTLIPISSGDNVLTATKTYTTEEFDPFAGVLLYYDSTALAANATIPAEKIQQQIPFDIRQSFNKTSITANRDCYIVAVPQANGKAKLHTDPFSQTLPTTEDGLIYIFIGESYSTTGIELRLEHPVYQFKNGKILLYAGNNVAENIVGTYSEQKLFEYRLTAGVVDVSSNNAYKAGKGAKIVSIKGATAHWNQLYNNSVPTALSGHKYYIREKVGNKTINESISTTISYTDSSTERMCVDLNLFYANMTVNVETYISTKTVSDFRLDFFKLFGRGLSYESYTEDTLISCNMTGFKTVGFNQWDEQWEQGSFNIANGAARAQTTAIRSTTFNKCIPGLTYYCKCGSYTDQRYLVLIFFDEQKRYLSHSYASNKTVTVPSNASYFKITTSNNANFIYGGTYLHDICISLYHSGTRTSDYESHWESTKNIPVTSLKGKLNGEGESVIVFANGMRSLTDLVYDEIVISGNTVRAIKRVGVAKLFNTTWNVGLPHLFINQIYTTNQSGEGTIPTNARIAVPGYSYCGGATSAFMLEKSDRTIGIGGTANMVLYIRDDSIDSIGNDIKDLDVYYELPTPEVYILDDFELPIYYDVDDWGTEQVIGSNVAPMFSIDYGINAPDTIKNLYKNFVSATEELNFSNTLKKRVLDNLGISHDITALADATDLTSAISLLNQIKGILVDSGIMKDGS